MRSSFRTIAAVSALAVIVAAAASALTTYAADRLRPRGSFHVDVKSASGETLPFFVTFTGGGGIVGSTIPLGCMGGQVVSPTHGAWDVHVSRGRPSLQFHLMADVYEVGDALGGSRSVGPIHMFGEMPLTGDGAGEVNVQFPPGPCKQLFDGPATFVATPLLATPPDPIKPPSDSVGH